MTTTAGKAPRVFSFPPLSAADAKVLILGSMPGTASLNAGQYYAYPRNAFWRIIDSLFGVAADSPYAERCAQLVRHRVAVWDVLKACTRSGSLDAAIDHRSVEPNDLAGLLAGHPQIEVIFFNGATAQRLFERHVLPILPDSQAAIVRHRLPSTSPAHASLGFEQKLTAWRIIGRHVTVNPVP